MTAVLPTKRELFGIAIGDCARIWRHKINQRLHPLGLSQATWLTLWHLSWFPDGLGQAELAERLGIESPTLVRLLDRLEKNGLLQRVPSSQDRRRKLVLLNESARPVLKQVKAIIAELRADILDAIPEEQLDAGLALLTLVRDRLSSSDPLSRAADIRS